MHYQEKVTQFMETFGQDYPATPTVPDLKTRILRVKLLLEEILELTEASGLKIVDAAGAEFNKTLLKNGGVEIVENIEMQPDLVEVADAIADISYVNYGAATAYGIDIAPVEEEVHNSNMTKLFTEEEAMQLNPDFYTVKPIGLSGRGFLVKNNDGKVQKSPSYTPANIRKHIDQQLGINE
jgi:predicted HAD superfamily Cof-like phosphohydrolase